MPASIENIRLLIVDDEDRFRRILAKRLAKRGMPPLLAANGPECLDLLEKKPFDVVVLDVKMPGMDGLEVLGIINQNYPKTEVIMLTGHATTAGGVEGIKGGAFDYLTKPIEFDHLLKKIKQAYEKIQREEEKDREAEFREKIEKQLVITERLASLGTLATGVAHEINNPLAIIKESAGWMQLMLAKDDLADMPRKEHFEKALEKIEDGIERARRITHQLLGFVKKHDIAFSEVNLSKLIEETLKLIHRQAEDKQVEFAMNIDERTGTIWSDPYPIRQVLINLFTNAIYATDPGGRITIATEKIDGFVTLTVNDPGKGIPKENLDRIFEPFFSTKAVGEGTGLGLYVSRGIIEKLGGKIEVESTVGQGTRFSVTLPSSLEVKEHLQDNKSICHDILDHIRNAEQQ
jgi:signal transduction histidine kinase